MALKWEAPEIRGSARTDWGTIAAELRANPDEWAVIAENMPTNVAARIKQGGIVAFRPAGHFEATNRGVRNGLSEKVYARFVGGA